MQQIGFLRGRLVGTLTLVGALAANQCTNGGVAPPIESNCGVAGAQGDGSAAPGNGVEAGTQGCTEPVVGGGAGSSGGSSGGLGSSGSSSGGVGSGSGSSGIGSSGSSSSGASSSSGIGSSGSSSSGASSSSGIGSSGSASSGTGSSSGI
jgi:hypothetical protein